MLAPHISVVNLGCRVNRVESDRITADLMRLGFAMVEPQDAELIVINTCAVTGEAEAKTRKAVRHALAYPNEPYVVVTGCVVNLHPEELLELSDRVIAEPSKIDVAERVCEVLGVESDDVPACSDGEVVDALGRSRLGVKIQDGCNHRCTYCIVWKARGPERSVPVESVLEQVREAQEAGVPEAVLTGVNLGAYDGKSATDEHVEIDELLEAIMERTSIPHVRISSVEPMDISESLLKVMARYPKRIAPFLHLPVQSGSDRLLKEMNRHYNVAQYMDLIRYAKEKIPGVTFSSDIIVGFPGETEEDFAATLDLIREVGYMQLFTFIYSKRTGTKAAEMPDPTPRKEKTDRMSRLLKIQDEIAMGLVKAQVGQTVRVLVESFGRSEGTLSGRLDNNLTVEFAADPGWMGRYANVHLTGARATVLLGELAD